MHKIGGGRLADSVGVDLTLTSSSDADAVMNEACSRVVVSLL